jgi:hypothetical protein
VGSRAVVLVLGFGIGVINGVLVTYARIDSFIATLGSGTVIYGIANWYTHGEQIISVNGFSGAFTGLAGEWFGIPIITYVTLVIAVILWVIFEHLPTGRYFYAVGANPRAAALSGIDTRRRIILAFGLCSLFAAAPVRFSRPAPGRARRRPGPTSCCRPSRRLCSGDVGATRPGERLGNRDRRDAARHRGGGPPAARRPVLRRVSLQRGDGDHRVGAAGFVIGRVASEGSRVRPGRATPGPPRRRAADRPPGGRPMRF